MEGCKIFVLVLVLALTEFVNMNEGAQDYHVYQISRAEQTYKKLKSTFLALTGGWPGAKFDIVFVMDKSGSIGQSDFKLQKRFLLALIESLQIPPSNRRVAVVTYSSSVKLEFDFNKFMNKESQLREKIPNIEYTGGGTATGPALQYVRNNLIFNAAAGARNGAKKVVFVLTDGRSNTGINPSFPAGKLKASGVVMFALGVTNSVRHSELLSIASSSKDVFRVENYATLHVVSEKLKAAASSSQLKNVARLPLPPLSARASRLFGASQADIRRVARLVAKIQPRRPVLKSGLRGADAKLGSN